MEYMPKPNDEEAQRERLKKLRMQPRKKKKKLVVVLPQAGKEHRIESLTDLRRHLAKMMGEDADAELRPLTLWPWLVRITKNGDDAILLSQILYWCEFSKGHEARSKEYDNQDRPIVAKGRQRLVHELGLTEWRVRAAWDRLETAGFIERYEEWKRYRSVSHVRPNYAAILAACQQLYRPPW
jgi:hypothetical protein